MTITNHAAILRQPLIRLGYSRYLLVFLILQHIAAMVLCLLLPLFLLVKLSLGLFILLSLWYWQLRAACRHHRQSIIALQYVGGTKWWLIDKTGSRRLFSLCGDSVLTSFVLVLNFRQRRWQRKSVVVCSDACGDQSDYRYLIRQIRFPCQICQVDDPL